MTDELRKPIILHVEDERRHQESFVSMMRNLAEFKDKTPDEIESHIHQIDMGHEAEEFIKENISDIAAVYTDNELSGERWGAKIMGLAKSAADEAGIPAPIRLWTSKGFPKQTDLEQGSFTRDDMITKQGIEAISKNVNAVKINSEQEYNKTLFEKLFATIDAVDAKKSKSALDMAGRTKEQKPGQREEGQSGGGSVGGAL